MSTVDGSKATLLLGLEDQLRGYQIGLPRLRAVAVEAPSVAPTVAAGTTGVLTGSLSYAYSRVTISGAETALSPWSTPASVTSKQMDISALDWGSDNEVEGIRIYRKIGSGAAKHIWTIWDATKATVTHTDNLAAGSEDASVAAPSADQTALNWGLRDFPFDPAEALIVDPVDIVPQELTGYLGEPRSIQTRVAHTFQGSASLRAGHLVPLLATLSGRPTVVRQATERVRTYSFEPLEEPEDAASLAGLYHMGGAATRPLLFGAARVGELEISSPGNAELQAKWKGMALWSSQESPGYADGGNSGTAILAPVIRGVRGDSGRYVDSVYVKCSAAPTGGAIGLKFKVGSGGTYGSEITAYYDTTSGQLIRYGAQPEPGVLVLYGTANDHLGIDTDRDFEPVSCVICGDVRTWALNDVFEFLPENLIADPRVGDAYSGQSRLAMEQAIYTAARVTALRGTSSASDYFEFEAAAFKLSRGLKVRPGQGPHAKRGTDLILAGFVTLETTFARLLDGREFERWARESQHLAWRVTIEGPRIRTNPGTSSTYREKVQIDIPFAAHSIKRTVPAMEAKETLTIRAKQPTNGAAHYTAQVVTGMGWDFNITAAA